MKIIFKLLITVFTVTFLFISLASVIRPVSIISSYNHRVFAEEEDDEKDEDHEEDKEDEDKEDDDKYEEVVVEEEVLVPAPKISYVWVYDAGYDVDTDGDLLVDAIDPNPTINEKLLYTDSDGDSVADGLDKYPGEDDYIYQEDTDDNQNGILDSYEQQ